MITDEQVKNEVEKRLKVFLESNPKDRILDDENVSDEVKWAYIVIMENAEKKAAQMAHYPTVGESPIMSLLEKIVRAEF